MGDNPDFSNLVGQNANDVKDSLLRDYPDVVKIVSYDQYLPLVPLHT